MGQFERTLAEIERYNVGWYDRMHVADVATWLFNWNSDRLVELYLDCAAVKRTTTDMWHLAKAARLREAAYVAMQPAQARAVMVDPAVKAWGDEMLAERQKTRPPYNKDGGPPA